jgi:hypothetical protein
MFLIAFHAVIGLASLSQQGADLPKDLIVTQAQPQPYLQAQGYMAPQSDYMTTAEGCTYRRTQAPGHPPRWILVVNPHHIGGMNANARCRGMIAN